MENSKTGFQDYLDRLKKEYKKGSSVAAIVMNANPFTLGHRYLVEQAARENDVVHLFAVSEDASLIPYSVRKRLIAEGIADLKNVFIHDSGPYIISNATFPSYFQRDEESVIRGHALLDLTIFTQIATVLGITGIYNEIMKKELPANGIRCVVVPRKEKDGEAISASTVRKAIQDNDMELLRELVPETTYRYFTSEEAAQIVSRIRVESNVVHY